VALINMSFNVRPWWR